MPTIYRMEKLILRKCKELKQQEKHQTIQLKWVNDQKRHFLKENINNQQIYEKYSLSLTIREV